ncbi:virion structural protein [Pseudomonas phage PA1C]|uniref:Uncharacterized protein n=2 Tax=root TaxID=1 RepID=A0A5C1K9E8_9CAUD|nr:Rz-like spanin [Pseudomonas phage vB_PaeM_PS119XW]QBX32321.1 virion structural protein [Pseudomonas phage PA1C]QEM41894.1 hypothetical protein [Pseudomonas phage vB_PaeM_PS119XW]BEG72409.1 hypothetical protein RVBP21_0370 [Pseudomonas phage BRkr]
MFNWLKNIKWFNWVFIGIVITGGLGLLFFYNQYTDQLVHNGSLVEKNGQLEVKVEMQGKSAAITDETVTQYTTQKVDELRELEQSRAGVIDEYINLSGQSGVSWPTTENVPVEKTRDEPIRKNPTTAIKDNGSVTDDVALITLANRMYEHYCKAKRLDPQCGTK